MSSDQALRSLCARFFDAVEAGDIDTVLDCYAADAVIWHNTDQLEIGPQENGQVLKGFVSRIADRVYEDRRVVLFPGGFMQQHVLRGTRRDGVRVTLPACVICQVEDGKIVRLDEYMDSAQVATFRAGPTAS